MRRKKPSLIPVVDIRTGQVVDHIDLSGFAPAPPQIYLPPPLQPKKKGGTWKIGLIIVLIAAVLGYALGPMRHKDAKPQPKPSASPEVVAPGRLTASSSKTAVGDAAHRLLERKAIVADARICDGGSEDDLVKGEVYYKAVNFLEEAAEAGFQLSISCVKAGHTSASGSETSGLHPWGKAVDVNKVDGEFICSNQTEDKVPEKCTHGDKVNKFGRWMLNRLKKPGPRGLPYMIGGPASLIDDGHLKYSGSKRRGPYFTNSDHEDHFHLGFECDPNHPDDFCSKGSESMADLKQAWKASPWY